MKKTITFVALFTLAVVGCGNGVLPVYTAKDEDGKRWNVILCRHKIDCLHRATRLCPKYGYVDKLEGQDPKSLMIRCKSEGFE